MLGLRIYDEKDNEIPDVGYAFFRDIETGKQIWVNTSSKRWRYNYAESQKQKIKDIKDAFEKSSASFVEVKAEDDYTRLLYNYFQKR